MSRAVCSRRVSSRRWLVWRNTPAGPVKGTDVQALQLVAGAGARGVGASLDDPGQEQGEPAEQDVGAYAVFEPAKPIDGAGAGAGQRVMHTGRPWVR
jgi:hypothetical protein